MKHMTVGLDLAKNVFHSVNSDGQRKKHKRTQLKRYFANLPPCSIAMEACGGSHYWAREFEVLGHTVTLLPPQHVKGYLRGQKNDFNDAQAIVEAAQHGKIRPVPIKSVEQQDRQALLRVRKLLTSEQTRLVSQVRGLLHEYGIVIAKGICTARRRIPEILEDAENGLSPFFRELLAGRYQRLQELKEEMAWHDKQIKVQAKRDDDCARLAELPGFGPIVSFAFKSWVGDGKQFKRGRDASAAIGLVPRQHSSGDKTVLMGITKQGDGYFRSLIVHGARSVVSYAKKKTDRLSCWINRLVATRGFNKAVIALANKLIRMAWVIIARQEHYRPQVA